MASFHIKIPPLLTPLVYLAIGLLTYVLLYAPIPFDWTNPWVYIVTLLWPFAWFYELLVWFLIFGGALLFIFLIWWMVFDS